MLKKTLNDIIKSNENNNLSLISQQLQNEFLLKIEKNKVKNNLKVDEEYFKLIIENEIDILSYNNNNKRKLIDKMKNIKNDNQINNDFFHLKNLDLNEYENNKLNQKINFLDFFSYFKESDINELIKRKEKIKILIKQIINLFEKELIYQSSLFKMIENLYYDIKLRFTDVNRLEFIKLNALIRFKEIENIKQLNKSKLVNIEFQLKINKKKLININKSMKSKLQEKKSINDTRKKKMDSALNEISKLEYDKLNKKVENDKIKNKIKNIENVNQKKNDINKKNIIIKNILEQFMISNFYLEEELEKRLIISLENKRDKNINSIKKKKKFSFIFEYDILKHHNKKLLGKFDKTLKNKNKNKNNDNLNNKLIIEYLKHYDNDFNKMVNFLLDRYMVKKYEYYSLKESLLYYESERELKIKKYNDLLKINEKNKKEKIFYPKNSEFIKNYNYYSKMTINILNDNLKDIQNKRDLIILLHNNFLKKLNNSLESFLDNNKIFINKSVFIFNKYKIEPYYSNEKIFKEVFIVKRSFENFNLIPEKNKNEIIQFIKKNKEIKKLFDFKETIITHFLGKEVQILLNHSKNIDDILNKYKIINNFIFEHIETNLINIIKNFFNGYNLVKEVIETQKNSIKDMNFDKFFKKKKLLQTNLYFTNYLNNSLNSTLNNNHLFRKKIEIQDFEVIEKLGFKSIKITNLEVDDVPYDYQDKGEINKEEKIKKKKVLISRTKDRDGYNMNTVNEHYKILQNLKKCFLISSKTK